MDITKAEGISKLGEIRKAKEIGYKGHYKLIWAACHQCDQERWVPLRNGKPQNEICHRCSNRGQGFWWRKSGIHPNLGKPLALRTRTKISEAKTRRVKLLMDENFAYFLGIIKGDGSVFRTRREHRIDISAGLNEGFANECLVLFSNIGLPARKIKSPEGYYNARACSKAFYNYLKPLNIIKTVDGQLPLMQAFWQGMFTAEGHLDRSRTPNVWQRLRISNTDKALIAWGKQCFEKLNYHPKVYMNKKNGYAPCYDLVISTQCEVARFLDRLTERREFIKKEA